MWRCMIFCACLSVSSVLADTATPTVSSNIGDRDKAGLDLARRIRAAAPREKTSAQGVLRIRNRDRKTMEIPMTFQVLPGGATWQVVYEAKHGSGTTEKLVIVHAPDRPNEYLYTKLGSTEPVKLIGNNAMAPFAGSDFWLADLGLEFLQWPVQRLVKTQMRKSVWCHVLESVNPSARPGGYARVISWLEKESGGPVVAEAYDSSGQKIKEFSINSLKKIEGEYQLKEMEISSREAGSRTKLEFQLDNK